MPRPPRDKSLYRTASLFFEGYNFGTNRFRRCGALPRRGLKSSLGEGGAPTLDGDPRRRRKQMFMSLMTPEGSRRPPDLTAREWHACGGRWEGVDRVVLFHEAGELLCRAACESAGAET